MLDAKIKQQLSEYLTLLQNPVVIKQQAGNDENSLLQKEFLSEIASMSDKITLEEGTFARIPSFSINLVGEDTGVIFSGVPLGHEFTSFVLALLQVGGRPPRIEQELINRIKSINQELHFTTYVSLTCNNCPEVVQNLNIMSILNPKITHTMVDGAVFRSEVEEKEILAVPTVYLNGTFFSGGKVSLEKILEKLGVNVSFDIQVDGPFDILVIGGGPAGVSAAIYAARKGVKVGIISEKIGGQILDTLNIENVIGIKQITGQNLALNFEEHMKDYNIQIIKSHRVKQIKKDDLFNIELENGFVLQSKTVIIATGARWRNLNVPGEEQFKNKGVAFCPHCDGPMFKNKDIAVVGGGNSGVEAAIDLAGTSSFVTLLEFMPELKADKVLQDKLYSLPNVKVLKNVQVKELKGSKNLEQLVYIDRQTQQEHTIDIQGVFIQIGLMPNTDWLGDFVERNRVGEIIVDNKGATSVPGVFAAGDCTNSPYKQIIISMGSGAIASLSAFEYLIKTKT
ncbi:MAG: alkyl hydroperoxide reductase subunit F [Acholeplasmataceae bacterium]|nr:alkyl hydroperoxide reductase subunit F [Acholeplasmataceae bacterium]